MTEIERNEYIRNSTEPTAVLMEKFGLTRQRIHKIRNPDKREAFPLSVGKRPLPIDPNSPNQSFTFWVPTELAVFVDSKLKPYQRRSQLLREIIDEWATKEGRQP